MSRLSIRLCIGFLIVLGLGISWQQQLAQQAREAALSKKADEEARLKKLHADLAASLASATAEDAAFVAAEKTRVRKQLSQLLLETEAAAVPVAQEIASMRGLTTLLIYMAKDQVQSTQSADENLNKAMAPYSDKLILMEAEASRSVGSLQHELNSRSNALAAQMLTSIQQAHATAGLSGDFSKERLKPIIKDVKNESIKAGATAAALPLDLMVVKSFAKAPLRKILARGVALTGSNAALAVADGPLPVGEVAAILLDAGFTAWTAWEIYHLSVKFPEECQTELKSGARKHHDELCTHVETQFVDMLRQMEENRKTTLHSLLAEK